MTRTSCIAHPARMALAILREDYLAICDGDAAAALILNALEHWTNSLMDRKGQVEQENEARQKEGLEPFDHDVWVYNTHEGWARDCLGMLKGHDVKRGLALLEAKGFVSKRHNPKYKWDRTLQYHLEVEAVNASFATCIGRQCQMDEPRAADQSMPGEPAIPETCTEIEPEKTAQAEPAVSSRPDFLDLAAKTYEKTKGKASWTVAEEAGGADPWMDGPVLAFCELVKVEQPPPKVARGWARQIRSVAGEWGASPEQAAQAIRMIPGSELGWRKFADAHDKGFQSVLGVMLGRVMAGGRADAAPIKVGLW